MSWQGNTEPADQPAIQNPVIRRRVDRGFQAAGFIGAFLLAGFAIYIFYVAFNWEHKRADAERELWGPIAVAEVYNECLDTRYGLQRGGLFGGEIERDDDTVVWQMVRGEIDLEGVDRQLERLGCDPLPKAAYEYRAEYGSRILSPNSELVK